MRIVKIDFKAENKLPDGKCLGRKGEHNATELNITLPSEMLNNAEVKGIVIVFQVGAHKVFHSDVHEKAETINYKLPREVTCANSVEVQLEGFDSDEELIIKSEVVDGLYFEHSVCGEDANNEVGKSLVGEIAVNTLARHTHENAEVLDKLGKSEGSLTYDGKVIGGSEGSSAKEYELFNADGLTVFAYEAGSPTGDIRPCILYGETFEDVPFKIGTKIEKVEIKTSETAQYRSLTLLNVDTSKPAIPVTNEYFLYKSSNTFFLAICMLGLSEQWTDIVDNMNWYSVRITYIDN